jgi:hypothetical protein
MIRARGSYVWTCLVVIGLCLFAMRQSIVLLSYGVAAAAATPETAEVALLPYIDAPITAAVAQRDLLKLAPRQEADAQIDRIVSLLGETPANGGAWLDLAIARLAAGAKDDQIMSSLALSNISAPYEAHVVTGRAVLVLSLWSRLPPEFRRNAALDLVRGWPFADEANRAAMKAVVSNATPQKREQIRAALGSIGKPAADVLRDLKLDMASAAESGPAPTSPAPADPTSQTPFKAPKN